MSRTAPRLVHKDPTSGQLVLNEDTLRALRSLEGPVGVVGIAGGARKGKSSLLNRIMESQGGLAQRFEASASVDPCTKGLLISTVPVGAEDKAGNPYSLLFLDTEGIDSTDQDRRDMAQVFTLCVLLSSAVILNELATINESTLDMLSLVSEITGIVRGKSTGGLPKGGRAEGNTLEALTALSRYSPSLFWVLRDFSLCLEPGVTPTDYMKQALRDVPKDGSKAASAADKNRVRRCIRALFPRRECVTLVRPLFDEEDLQECHWAPLEDLRPEFQAGVTALAQAVCAAASPPRVYGAPLTGPLLASLCEAYVNAMNAGAVPLIESVHLTSLEDACSKAADKAERVFAKTLGEATMGKRHKLEQLRERGFKEALGCFRAETRDFPKHIVDSAKEKLRIRIQRKSEHFEAEVEALVARHKKWCCAGGAGVGTIAGAGIGVCVGTEVAVAGGAAIVGTEAVALGVSGLAAAVSVAAPVVAACAVLGGLAGGIAGLGIGEATSAGRD